MKSWLIFALMTVACWGLYGIYLHEGQILISGKSGTDPLARYKAFLWVGIAYFLVAIVGPLLLIMMNKGDLRFWSYPAPGIKLSLFAGILGAIGAFCVLLAFGAKGSPPIVMSIIFAGAPIVNAVVSLSKHPPDGGWAAIPKPFFIGILMAAVGAYLVVRFKPKPGTHSPTPPPNATSSTQPGA